MTDRPAQPNPGWASLLGWERRRPLLALAFVLPDCTLSSWHILTHLAGRG